MQQHPQSVSKTSSRYVALEEGLKQFSMDLNKLEVIGLICKPDWLMLT